MNHLKMLEVLLEEGGPTSNDRVLLRDRRGETQTQRRSPGKTEVETGGRGRDRDRDKGETGGVGSVAGSYGVGAAASAG